MAKNDKMDDTKGGSMGSSKGGSVNPVEIQKFLAGMDFPATKKEIIDMAKKNKADQTALDALQRIPDQDYEKPTDISRALGEMGGKM